MVFISFFFQAEKVCCCDQWAVLMMHRLQVLPGLCVREKEHRSPTCLLSSENENRSYWDKQPWKRQFPENKRRGSGRNQSDLPRSWNASFKINLIYINYKVLLRTDATTNWEVAIHIYSKSSSVVRVATIADTFVKITLLMELLMQNCLHISSTVYSVSSKMFY